MQELLRRDLRQLLWRVLLGNEETQDMADLRGVLLFISNLDTWWQTTATLPSQRVIELRRVNSNESR